MTRKAFLLVVGPRAPRLRRGWSYPRVVLTTRQRARSSGEPDLGGLNLSDVPAVFLESGNMRNAKDAALLRSAPFRTRAARAIVAGVSRFLERSEVIRPGSSR